MATVPRKFIMTSRAELNSLSPVNGQIIGLWDNDEVYYDAPEDGSPDGKSVRRRVSGIQIITSLETFVPAAGGTGTVIPMTDNIYVYLSNETLPSGDYAYDMRIWKDSQWYIVGTNVDDTTVKTTTSDSKFYITGTPNIADDDVGPLNKNSNVYIDDGVIYGDLDGTASHATHADTAADATNAVYAEKDTLDKSLTGYVYTITADPNVLGKLSITTGGGTSSVVWVKLPGVFSTTDDGLVPKSDGTGETDKFLKGNGTWGLPAVFSTGNPGLVPAPTAGDANKVLSGGGNWVGTYTNSTPGLVPDTGTVQPSDNTGLILSGSGWIHQGTVPAAESATNDGLGQNIANTYYKDATFDTTNKELTLTKGNGTTNTVVSIPYVDSDFDGTASALVPEPLTADPTLSLRANGTWVATPDDTTGSTQYTVTPPAVAQPLYLTGALSQTSSAVTYTDSNVFSLEGRLYQSDGATPTPSAVEVVDVSSTQTLSNKSFEINNTPYAVGTAVGSTVNTAVDPNNNPIIPASGANNDLPTNAAVRNYVTTVKSTIQQDLAYKVNLPVVAPVYAAATAYTKDTYVMYDDGNGAALYKCIQASTGNVPTDTTYWIPATVMGITLVGTLTAGSTSITLSDASITANSHIEVWADNGNVNYTNISSTTGSVTITFLAQASNMTVEVRVS